MARKPKGYYHRYELVRRPVSFTPEITKDWWCIVKYYGRGKGAGIRHLDSDPGADVADDALITRAGLDSVTVPVYIVRNGQVGEPFFGQYYGQS